MKQLTKKNALTWRRPELYDKQLAALFHEEKYGAVAASTKSGKTHAALIWMAEQAWLHGGPGKHYWWAAPTLFQTEIAYSRMKESLPRGRYTAKDYKRVLILQNGAIVSFKTGEQPDNLYGEDVFAVVIDEASRVREEVWHAIRSTTTATEGKMRLIGNVHGRKNWFYQLARKAEAGEPGMVYTRITAYDAIEADILSQQEVEDAQDTLPNAVFRELHLNEPAGDASCPFEHSAIERCITGMNGQPPAVWAWDVARGKQAGADWTVDVALDEFGCVCRLERFQRPWKDTLSTIERLVGTDCRAHVDSTGVGNPIAESLQQYFPLIEPFLFTATSKQNIMEGLAVAIPKEEIKFPEGVLAMELRNFEYSYSRTGYRYSAPEGAHDDCVCALAMAVSLKSKAAPMSWAPIRYAEDEEGYDREDNFHLICEGIGGLQ
jgi:hypothetical protein